jgi:quinol monooxygenase YgiN
MSYIRLSIAKARPGEEERFRAIMVRLQEVTKSEPGCKESYLLEPRDDSGDIARISIYDSELDAERAANGATIMALRSEMHSVCAPGHTERAFFSI